MRIAIDCIPLLLRSAGVKTYIYNWYRNMRRQAAGDTLLAWPYLEVSDRYSHQESAVGAPGTLARLALLHAATHLRLPVVDWIGPKVDVFHASQQMWNPPRSALVTATLYDMTCWLLPETHSARNVQGARLFAERVMRRANGLIAISESTRQDAIRILGLDPGKIEVIYPGIAEAFFHATPASTERPYVLFVGTVEPRKNLDTVLDAWKQVRGELRADFDLIVAGPAGWGNPSTLERLRSGDGGVRYLGYVPEEDLPGLTAGAAVFVYPSLYEGFGLPLGQAMAAGVPLITSNVSSMPEVAGDAALLVDPRSPAEITAAIERLLGSPELRATLSKNGLARSHRFTWDSCARQSLTFLRRL